MITKFTKRFLVLSVAVIAFAFSASAQTIIFNEEFNGGFGTFTAGPGNPVGAVWEHSTTGDASSNAAGTISALFWGARVAIQSPTVANGCAMYNSDVYDGGGTAVGGGAYPGTHSGAMTSPSIDLSGYNAVTLKFNQYARANANAVSTLIDISLDTGATWINIPFNSEVTANGSNGGLGADVELLDISAIAGGQPDVQIRFTWSGRYYFWLVDDVQIIKTPDNNLSISAFNFAPYNYATPFSQLATDTFDFDVNISNVGGADQHNVVVVAEVTDANLNRIWADSVSIATLPAGYSDSLLFFASYVPDTTVMPVGDYAVVYSVRSDSVDFDSADNLDGEFFEVSDSLFAKEDGAGGANRPGGNPDYLYGTLYKMSWNQHDNWLATNVYFSAAMNAADGVLEGKNATFYLAEVSPTVASDFSNFDAVTPLGTHPQLSIVGLSSYTFPAGAANYDDFFLEIEDFNTGLKGVPIKGGTRYMLLVEYSGANNVIFHAVGQAIDYQYQFKGMVAYDGSNWFTGYTGGGQNAPYLRMDIRDVTPTVGTNNVLVDAKFDVFPNPASDYINMNVSFDKPTDASVYITDITGKLLRVQELGQVSTDNVRIDVSSFPAGTYIAKLSTREGLLTKKFVVTK